LSLLLLFNPSKKLYVAYHIIKDHIRLKSLHKKVPVFNTNFEEGEKAILKPSKSLILNTDIQNTIAI